MGRPWMLFLIAMALLLPGYAEAQNQHPNQARGFNSNGVYSSFDIDHINTFNGNLLVTIPIGQRYPVNGDLSYSLNLIYNSNAWSAREVCPNTVDQAQWSSTFLSVLSRVVFRSGGGSITVTEDSTIGGGPSAGDDYSPRNARSGTNECWTIQDPNPAANAGLGWQITMGMLYQPRIDVFDDRASFTEKSDWVYMSPDGSEHTFYPKLHNDDPAGSTNIWYTRDGSYLRLNFNSPDTTKGNMLIEFPNGEKQYFTPVRVRAAAGGRPELIDEYVSRIEDQFGNFVRVQYFDTSGDTVQDDVWLVSDSVGRNQTIYFASPQSGFPKSVSQITLEAFGTQSANYYFQYAPRTIARPVPHVPPGLATDYDDNVNVNFLTGITLPDSSTYSMPIADSYFLPASDHYTPGVLQKIVLPTGGNIQWKYESEDPAGDLNAGVAYHFGLASAGRHYQRSSFGVRRRILTEGQNTYTWKYDPKLGDVSPTGCIRAQTPNSCAPIEFVNTVTTPQGDHTRYYFSVYPYPYDSGGPDALKRGLSDPHSADYGLPFTKDPRRVGNDPVKSYADSNNQPLFLSEAIYDAAWNLKRSNYVRYEMDVIDPGDGFGSMRDANSRVVASRTVYNDDLVGGIAKYAEVQNTEFDGVGHYRRTTTYGNFGAGDGRTEVTTYNQDIDGSYRIYSIDPTQNQASSNSNYRPFSESRPWLLNLYDYKTTSDYSLQSTTYFQFNSQGVMTAMRTRKDFETSGITPSLGANDVLVKYSYDASGNVVGKAYFGGNKIGHLMLDTSNRFPLLNDSSSEYKINYGHQCVRSDGTTSTISVVNNTTYRGVNFKSTDDTIDCRTGLAKSSRDIAGVQTTYDYSDMGRLLSITRQEGNYEQIQYQRAINGSLPKVTVTQLDRNNPNIGSGTLGQEIYVYDQLGRLIIEKKLLPGGVYQVRTTNYNGMGWTTDVSEWSDGSTGAGRKTIYSNFDPFGRAATITMPDDRVVTMGYLGVRQLTRTVSVAAQIDGGGNVSEQSSTTKQIYDAQGRLAQVIEPSGVSGQEMIWNYRYNVKNQIAGDANQPGVSATDPVTGVTQKRTFSYDNLGNLLTQSIPERPSAQSFEHDTMGNMGKSYDGTHWLNYIYDNAGRPTLINESTSQTGPWRPVKQSSYYDVNGGTGGTFALGKLATSTRHNYVLNPYEAHQNVSMGKPATQSSTYVSSTPASLAVDGNTNGYGNYTHTNYDYHAWWQIDLGASYSLDQVNLWNRLDCCSERLSNFYVLVSDQPFTSTDLSATLSQSGVSGYYVGGTGGSPTTVSVPRSGRYVRVQLAGSNYLSLSEVQVIGSSTTIYDIGVTEQYAYSGIDGRMSYRSTATNIPNGPSFEQSFSYDQLGNLASQSYPKCTNLNCTQSGAQRPWTVNYGYTNGALTSVGGGAGEGNTPAGTYATALTYNINGTVATVTHRNNVIDRMALDTNYMQRPRQLTSTLGTNTIFDTGLYSYDGAGNVKRIGNDWYLYDKVNRLKEGTALLSGMAGDPLKRLKQQYDYDSFGNRLQTRTYNSVSLTTATLKDTYDSLVNSATNRLALSYDNAGNTLGAQNAAPTYSYDSFNMISTAPGLTYLYGPNEERFWIIDTKQNNLNSDNEETFTLRGLGNEVLREYKQVGGNAVGNWFWQKDYVYRGGTLLAAETAGNGVMHYHVDHLGSPRLVTDANGTAWERNQFLPFGENSGYYRNNEYWSLSYIGPIAPTRLRFTGHEKDSDVLGLDYMRARHFWERNGRFMSVDPGKDWDPKQPQSWNLYSYVRNNPTNSTDPTGLADNGPALNTWDFFMLAMKECEFHVRWQVMTPSMEGGEGEAAGVNLGPAFSLDITSQTLSHPPTFYGTTPSGDGYKVESWKSENEMKLEVGGIGFLLGWKSSSHESWTQGWGDNYPRYSGGGNSWDYHFSPAVGNTFVNPKTGEMWFKTGVGIGYGVEVTTNISKCMRTFFRAQPGALDQVMKVEPAARWMDAFHMLP